MQYSTIYTTNNPKLQYTFNITTTGIYTVWLRGYAANAAGDSLYLGLDGSAPDILTGFVPRTWSWANSNDQNNPVTMGVNRKRW